MRTSSDPMLPLTFRIRKAKMETRDTFTFELTPPPKYGEFSFKPGQFNMLYTYGVGEIPISISGDPGNSEKLIHTTRAVGTVTNAMIHLKKGDAIGVRGPFGTAWPVEKAEGNDVVLIAGGIGLAPLRPAFYHILANRDKYGKVFLLYGTRTPEDILFHKQLREWRGRFDLDVEITVDHARDQWRGNVGVVTHLISSATFDPSNTLAMICGPEIMMRFCAIELKNMGVPFKKMYVSMERNMKCAIGFCGHCQYGPHFICKDGPVFRYDRIRDLFLTYEI